MQHSHERLYQTGLWIKGINGALELLGGIAVLLAPTDWFLKVATLAAPQFGGSSRGFAVFYLLSHGVLKILIAALLLRHVCAAYPVGIALFAALIAYEVYRLARHPGILIGGMVALDAVILALIVHHRVELRTIRTQRS
ncbi:MAG TPA: DUF2127 domain-containing protein [Planctomycetota bacterium]|nr:DUF2127 domain-containing protein [Planctomycetota bacterium]